MSFGWIPVPAGWAPYGKAAVTGLDGADACFRHDGLIRRGGDQDGTNSCVLWGYSGGLWVLGGILGLPQKWASVLGGYYSTRMLDNGGKRDLLVDVGCNVTDAAWVHRRQGWIPDAAWPFDPRKVNAEPPLHAFLRCRERTWLRPRRIVATGPQHAKIIRQTLDASGNQARPILRATRVDQAYLDWAPGFLPWRFQGPLLGRHLELAVNYDRAGVHRVSSWGDEFDRVESWESVETDRQSETWVLDVDVDAFREFCNA